MSLPAATRDHYQRIIDGILASADLNTISAKRIRKGLQTAVDHDISPYKDDITSLILQRFDLFTAREAAEKVDRPKSESTSATAKTNGTTTNSNGKRTSPSSSTPSSAASASPVPVKKRKHKGSQSVEETDAAYAARLQAEENGRSSRATRGGGTKRKAATTKKREKKPKKKSKNRVGSDDDSDAATGEEKEVKTTGFHKPMVLSQPLADLLGESTLSRPQTVKKIWQYIKANDLQDPSDKRQIMCDDRLRSIFKADRVHMFTMNKVLSQNLYAADE